MLLSDEVGDEYSDRGIRLIVGELDDKTLLIEGSREALVFLGKLLLAHADDQRDHGAVISPFAAGSLFFSEKATRGLHVHPTD
jgi:hypothetical protein